mgnify:CR=1 FL=1
MKPKFFSFITIVSFIATGFAAYTQDDVSYKLPPKDIADMLLAKAAPAVSIDNKGEWMLLMESSSYPSVEELARPELKVAGLRINPANFGPSRQNYINNLYLKNIATGKEMKITGLPSPLFASNISWSPDNRKINFTHTTSGRIDLYIIDVAAQKAVKVNKSALNVITGAVIWYDNNLLRQLLPNRPCQKARLFRKIKARLHPVPLSRILSKALMMKSFSPFMPPHSWLRILMV